MASASITFTFPENAFGQREHGQPLRKLKSIRRETGAKFIIDLKKVDADGNLTCEWSGINDQCLQARKLMVAAVRKYNAWKRHQPRTLPRMTPRRLRRSARRLPSSGSPMSRRSSRTLGTRCASPRRRSLALTPSATGRPRRIRM